jgi:regulator of replication initiation timing
LEKYSHHTYRQLAMIIENLEKEVSGLERWLQDQINENTKLLLKIESFYDK